VLNTHDITTLAKDAHTYLKIVDSELAWVKVNLLCFIIAWCTDASGESVKMKKELRKKYPWLIVLDCWSHQVMSLELHMIEGRFTRARYRSILWWATSSKQSRLGLLPCWTMCAKS
jgi:hypothetical protein